MPKARRRVALGPIGLVIGALALSGCITTKSVYDEAYGGSSVLAYDPYWTPPLEYRQGYPGYYAYPRYYVYSPGYYSYQRYYGPTVFPPPPGHARRDRGRDDGDRGSRGNRGDRDGRGGNVSPPAVDRQPRSNSNSRRPPPFTVPMESPGDTVPAPRRGGRQEPAREVPE